MGLWVMMRGGGLTCGGSLRDELIYLEGCVGRRMILCERRY